MSLPHPVKDTLLPTTHWGYPGQHRLLLLAPERIIECHGDDPRVQTLDGIDGQLGDPGIVEQRLPSLLHLLQGEAAGEVDAQVHGAQVVSLLHGTD